jgi:CheY-like chemotaxis protein
VLLDLMMPDMDGYQTIRKIRQEKELKSLPVFIVTAKAMKGDREECLRHGATDYISKPVSPEKLEKLMSIWMD